MPSQPVAILVASYTTARCRARFPWTQLHGTCIDQVYPVMLPAIRMTLTVCSATLKACGFVARPLIPDRIRNFETGQSCPESIVGTGCGIGSVRLKTDRVTFMNTKTVSAVLLVLGCVASIAMGDDWTEWRGPSRNGVSEETGLAKTWSLETGENVLWSHETGGRATPIIMNGRVFLDCRTSHDVSDPEQVIHSREQVVCWDLYSGKELWRHEFNVFQTDIPAPRVGWASMCGDPETGNVYVHSVSGMLICMTADGEKVWEHSLVEEFGAILGYGGRVHSPIIDEDRLVISFLAANWGDSKGPGPMHYYYAFDKKTGSLQWVAAPGTAPEGTNYSTPIVTVIDGQRMLVGGNGDGGIYAINARTGQKVWGMPMSHAAINATPVVSGERVYINHGADNVDNPEFGRVQCLDATQTGDLTAAASIWRIDGIKADSSSPLVHDGLLFVVSDTGNLFCIDAENGAQLWTQNIGTVGKGSPTWADGHLFVTEVNGNIHTLKPSREKCEVVNTVHLRAVDGNGDDEIYASPAFADGRMLIVSRDRIICVGTENAAKQDVPADPLAPEGPAEGPVATIQLRPFESTVVGPGSVSFQLHCYDSKGRLLEVREPEIALGDGIAGEITNATLTVAGDRNQAGTVVAKLGDLETKARVRVINGAQHWSWDFEGLTGVATPPGWIRAFAKMKPTDVEGNTAMKFVGMGQAKGRPSHTVWLGTPDMNGYEIHADVRMAEQRRQLSSIGLTANRYTFMLRGNYNKISVQSWPAHQRLGADATFKCQPDVWYTMKMDVDIADGQAVVRGKIWPRDEAEPDQWNMTATDPHPNLTGSPGLFVYAQTDCLFDNVRVSFDEAPGAAAEPATKTAEGK